MRKYNIAIVGATGLVGRTFLKVLEEYKIEVGELHLFASHESIGKMMEFNNQEYYTQELKEEGSFIGIDFALFSAGKDVSKIYAPIAMNEGAIVIDNSPCFRMKEDCALIVPEINLSDYHDKSRIIANPNCSTIQAVLPLKALESYGIKRVNYTTYQAVSGSGKKGLDELERVKRGEKNSFYPYDILKTCIPEIGEPSVDGYTSEEIKMINETRKILHMDQLKVSATCVRVPVEEAHGVLIAVELEKEFNLEDIKISLADYPSIKVIDDIDKHIYPVSTLTLNNDLVYVGRIRRDLSADNGLLLYTVSNNVRKGAASNAIQIMKGIIEEEEYA